jgi:hypothetical protein
VNRLSRESFDRARRFLMTEARALSITGAGRWTRWSGCSIFYWTARRSSPTRSLGRQGLTGSTEQCCEDRSN